MQTWEIFFESTFATFETFWKVWTSYLLWCTSPPWFQVLETGGKDPVPTCEPRRSPQFHLWWNSPETVYTISMVQNSWYELIEFISDRSSTRVQVLHFFIYFLGVPQNSINDMILRGNGRFGFSSAQASLWRNPWRPGTEESEQNDQNPEKKTINIHTYDLQLSYNTTGCVFVGLRSLSFRSIQVSIFWWPTWRPSNSAMTLCLLFFF